MSNAHQKSDDRNRAYHLPQKLVLEINPRHQLIKGMVDLFISNKSHGLKIDYETNLINFSNFGFYF